MGHCVQELLRSNFDPEVLHHDGPVLVDFFGANCPPCALLAPTLEQFCAARAGSLKVVKIDVENCRDLARKYQLMGVPSLLLFRGGEPVDRRMGLISRQNLEKWLDEALAA